MKSGQAEVAAARQLRERWERRAEAVAALEAVMEDVRGSEPPTNGAAAAADALPAGAHGPGFWAAWEARLGVLAAAIEAARSANIGVGRAKRLLKDMQAQAAAAAAARRLDAVLAACPAGSGMLKVRGDPGARALCTGKG